MTKEQIERQFLEQGRITKEISDKKKVHGTRYALLLEGRDIEVVYYEVARPNAPLLVGMHGGGFLMGGCAFDDAMWTAMRDYLQVNVVSIGYRKTPEYAYPAALQDVYDAVVYLMEQMPQLDFDRQQVSVFGNSAGANLAAAVCLLAKEKGAPQFKYQVLNYPFLDIDTPPEKKPGAAPDGDFTVDHLFNRLYVKPEQAKESKVSPVFAKTSELEGLPEAIIIVSENDTLRKEGEDYAAMLQKAGVKVSLMVAKQMPHAFFERGYGKVSPEQKELYALAESGILREQMDAVLAFIKEHLQ